jgi:hypothetical protein
MFVNSHDFFTQVLELEEPALVFPARHIGIAPHTVSAEVEAAWFQPLETLLS